MAYKQNVSSKVTVVTTPSFHGSHASMVVEELEDGKVLCKDDRGTYTTLKERLDNGLADPARNRLVEE